MIRYIEKGIGLHEAIRAAGHSLVRIDGEWIADDPAAVQAIIDAYDPLVDKRASAYLTRLDFAARAAAAGFITYDEAADWAVGVAIPAAVRGVIDSLPEAMRGPTILEVRAMPVIRRNARLMPGIIAAFGATPDDMDRLFGIE